MTDRNRKKAELLAPAGDYEKLEIAIHFGADAVYLGGKDFNLRNFSGNFSLTELEAAITYAHKRNVRVYLTLNTYPRASDIPAIRDYLKKISRVPPDAIILADPGVFMLTRSIAPHIPVHLSTQANTTHADAARFWRQLGAKRINAAREMSIAEVREIAAVRGIEVETFVHGAMCIAYSGRCLLSSYLTGRDSNRGHCAHTCRWGYALVEETRPGQYLPIEEDSHGSYILSAKDLCMIEHVDDLLDAGVSSLKIEGRMKGIHYLSTVVKTYRDAIDGYYRRPNGYRPKTEWLDELSRINYRGYGTGFYYGSKSDIQAAYHGSLPVTRNYLIGKIIKRVDLQTVAVDVRDRIGLGDAVVVFRGKGSPKAARINALYDAEGRPTAAVSAGDRVIAVLSCDCKPNDLLRRPAALLQDATI